uniref:Uncharacterized protein n=1 Tax=Octopus bimaculoides TaxID=37653 RepID=A0A0L8GCW2_OCTBM
MAEGSFFLQQLGTSSSIDVVPLLQLPLLQLPLLQLPLLQLSLSEKESVSSMVKVTVLIIPA